MMFNIPHHGVNHPKKINLRSVFDSTASFQDVSLNKELIQGPDLTTTLVGVLLRFCEELIAKSVFLPSQFTRTRCSSPLFSLLTEWQAE